MEELRREFLRETVASLETLLNKFSAAENDSLAESLRRELFRRLHTVKGTAQTFEFGFGSGLAHKIENLLQAAAEGHVAPDENFKHLILEGIGILLENFRRAENNQETISPRAYLDKINDFIPERPAARPASRLILTDIPAEFLASLSKHETDVLATEIESGASFYLIAAFFDFAAFSEKFKEFKKVLSERGEVVAAAPAPDAPPGAIGFRFFFTTRAPAERIKNTIEPFGAQALHPPEIPLAEGVTGVLQQAAQAGGQAARALGKQVDFEVEAGDGEIAARQLKTLFEASLHLIRNAVDHGIEPPDERIAAGKPERGKIKLSVATEANGLILRVADDGRGIDAEKIRAKAVAWELVAAGADLSDEAVLQMIFAHGFSTSETVSEISGRGVGLDAVKDAAEQSGGTIGVSSEKGHGTTFEIRLPKEDEPQRHGDSEKIK